MYLRAIENVRALLQSDNGPHFIAAVIKEFISMVGTEQFLNIAYSKEENTIVERRNKEINRHIRASLLHTKNDYKPCLPFTMRIINSSESVRTGFAASEMLATKQIN
jgi:transposase InsO family protein